MLKLIRKIIPQPIVNNLWHLPKAILPNVSYGFPSRGMTIIGVTGTDGKTTTTNMIHQILRDAGKSVSMVSTINAVVGDKSYDTGFHVTSPDPFVVQKLIKDAKTAGSEFLVLEVTSHALDQHRFWGVKFDVGVVTNITHEHLDYHKTFENYKNTKLRLLKNVKYAVVNENLKIKGVTFGLTKGDVNQKKEKIKLKIHGNHNIENVMAALAVSRGLGIDQEQARKTLENFQNLSGRMEEFENSKGISKASLGVKIFIDFAHTPNGLQNALYTLRDQGNGKIFSVIGCEGFRDIGKREMMGEISGKLADVTVVTAVDPRGQLDKINEQIIKGIEKTGKILGKDYFVINDRSKAIKFVIDQAKKDDVIGIFGKGHEKSMNLDGKKEIAWSDRIAVEKALSNG